MAADNGQWAEAWAHPNIALVKYWGKRPGPYNLPAVGSLSVTLDTFVSHTEVRLQDHLAADALILGRAPASGPELARTQRFLRRLRSLLPGGGAAATLPFAQVTSHNNFPTAAGLASSASGFAALTLSAAAAYGLRASPDALSALAREGSGSAARSLYGGFVRQHKGEREDGADAVAQPLAPAAHWPLRLVVAITARGAKATSSTDGMVHTRETSPFWPAWVAGQADDLALAEWAVMQRDFAALAQVAEHSCLKMHALAQAARPGLLYFTPATLAAMQAVQALRRAGTAVFFTVDAGPQLKAVCLPEAEAAVARTLAEVPGVLQVVRLGLGTGAAMGAPTPADGWQ